MKTENLFGVLMLFFCACGLISCDNGDEEGRKITDYQELVLTVASKQVPGMLPGSRRVSEIYAVKKEQGDAWSVCGGIAGFKYEKGYEFRIKVSETTYQDDAMDNPSWTERNLLEVISKERKDSEDLPLHLIPETYYKSIPLPAYKYKVEAEHQELIEADLEAHPILPKDYYYMLCESHEGLKWIGIQNESNIFGPYILMRKNKKPEEMPASYQLLPPEGRIVFGMEWRFLNEEGNATDYPPFDVFIGNSSKTKSVAPYCNMLCFYKDLTRYYQDKYPDAGVETVVVSYTFKGFY